MEDPDAFSIPEEMILDADIVGRLSDLITRLLTRARSTLKEKLMNSLPKGGRRAINLNVLCKSMVPKGMMLELHKGHQERNALNVSSILLLTTYLTPPTISVLSL